MHIINPYTQRVIGELPLCEREEALAGLERAVRAVGGAGSVQERKALLECVALALAGKQEAFARQIAEEGGKPLVDARIEVARAVDGLRLATEEMEALFAPVPVPMGRTKASEGRVAYTLVEPVGVVLAISAFNHPLNLIVHQVAPAVAVGCPVIVKPSLSTPYSCLALVELFREAGLPEDRLQVVLCEDAVAEELASDPRVQYVSFIGSARVGWHLRRVIAPGTRIGLEHGGIAPVIVAPSALLERVVEPVVKGGMYHAGQVCVSTQRVFVPRDRLQEVAEALVARVTRLVVGDPLDEATEVGPLIRAREVERVDAMVREAVGQGATLLCGGKVLGHQCYAPTVLKDVPVQVRVSQEELFGPAIMLYAYDRMDEAFAMANHARWSFQASVFAEDRDEVAHAIRALDSAAVMVNESTAFRTDWMPFGGRRESGLGVGGIPYTMREYTQHKLVVEQR